MRKELHVSHIPQPPKPVTIPLSSKKKNKKKQENNKQKKKQKKQEKNQKNNKKKQKKQKNQKQELRMRIFLRYHMDRKDRNVTYIYSFEPNSFLGCQGDSDDVIGSKSQYS